MLAERVYQDVSGKKIIAGTFNSLSLKVKKDDEKTLDGSKKLVFGGTDPGCPSVYISLTDVVDGTEVTLQFFNVSKNKVLFEKTLKIACNDPLATVEIIAPLPPIRGYLEPGTFSFDIVWQGEILGSHRIVAKLAPESD